MIIYILKLSACLAFFLAFYKLVLEKENMHVFKRFYLLGALLLSIGIPLITFTYYVELSTEIVSLENTVLEIQSQTNYLPIILIFIYSLGIILFGYKFIKNLYQLNHKIKNNPKQRSKTITNVLLKDLIVPHTFFNFIFFNKQKFETHKIPKEVIWHEETHAIQKHSIDVLFIEIIKIVFWFNPLMYVLKHFIKLNHEFLADQAVLKKGIKTITYQETLLAFSSNNAHPQLANAINYSLIKKRFTVMKTQTSKKGIWLRSILLLPILAILLFSFSSKIIVPEEKYIQVEKELISNQEKATKKQVKEYNALAKKYNDMSEDKMVIKKNDIERLKYLYNLMSVEQHKKAQPFPSFPAPPPAPNQPKVPRVIELREAPPAPDAPEAQRVLKMRKLPPPPPLPANATPAEKKKHKETIKNYKLKTQKVKLQKIKEGELIKVRKLQGEDRKQLLEAKLAYREGQVTARANKIKAEKGELMKVRKLRAIENREKLRTEKLVYIERQIAAKALKLKAERKKLTEVRKIHSAEDKKRLKEEKKAYKKSQAKIKALKNKSKNKEN